MPRFTIGIPTYNRAHQFLGRAIQSALDQTHPDVEVIVCDNASTDNTEEIVRGFGDRVRYHRNEKNLGMWPNFTIGPELATGEFFAWLQDDDLIHRDFAARVVRSLSASDDHLMYVCWAAYSPSPTSLRKWTSIHGPVIPVDWMGSEPKVIDGLQFIPFCFFESQALPPAVAFRTEAARLGVRDFLPDCAEFNEQVVVSSVAARGKVVIDPWVGAIHSSHGSQSHLVLGGDPDAILRQKLNHAAYNQTLISGLPDRWRGLFRETLAELPLENRLALVDIIIHYPEKLGAFWAAAPPVIGEMRDMVLETLPAKERSDRQWMRAEPDRGDSKQRLKRVVPYRLWASLKTARDALRHGVAMRIKYENRGGA
jgi:glycosyltransferase involved in cell wall biosynthesis